MTITRRRRLTILAVLAATALSAAGCGEESDSNDGGSGNQRQESGSLPAEVREKAKENRKKLLDFLGKAQSAPGRLVARPGRIEVSTVPGERGRASIRVVNEGGRDVTINQIENLLDKDSLSRVRGRNQCAPGTILKPASQCTVAFTFTPISKNAGTTTRGRIIIRSDAEKNSILEIPVVTRVESPPTVSPAPEPRSMPIADLMPAPEPTVTTKSGGKPPRQPRPEPEPEPQPTKEKPEPRAGDAAIAAARSAPSSRLAPAASRSGTDGAKIVRKRQRSGYPRSAFPGTDATLPVNRERILTQDRTIPAVLKRPITNVMCGRVTAIVETDVYAPEGDNILIPGGSSVIGKCANFTNSRGQVVWQRIIMPNGRSVRISGLSTDANGRGGIPGNLDRRLFDRFGIPLLFSAFRSGTTLLLGEDTNVVSQEGGNVVKEESATNRALKQFQATTRRLVRRLERDLKDVRRVLVIPAGTRFTIVPGRDLYFPKNRPMVRTVDGMRYMLSKRRRQGRARPVTQRGRESRGPRTVTIDGRTYRLVPGGGNGRAGPNYVGSRSGSPRRSGGGGSRGSGR